MGSIQKSRDWVKGAFRDPGWSETTVQLFVPGRGLLLIIPRAVALRFAALEHIPEMGMRGQWNAIEHFIENVVLEKSVVLALGAVGQVVHVSLLFQMRHPHDRL